MRVADAETGDLEARAVAAQSRALAAEIAATRIPLGDLPEAESGLEDGPRALAELAAGLGLEHGLVVPVVAA